MSRFKAGDVVKHRKGGVYRIVGTPERVRLEADAAPAYAYEALDGDFQGTVWVRDAVEMEDGRFTLDQAREPTDDDVRESFEMWLGILRIYQRTEQLSDPQKRLLEGAFLAGHKSLPSFVGMAERPEDMSTTGRLRVFRQEDGDMCLQVTDEHGNVAAVEFCTPMQGGGRSPETWAALQRLAKAMQRDMRANP